MISYISMRGAMRDAQIEAIKIYLFLKIACNNEPLAQLFLDGRFNTLDLEEEELKKSTREYLMDHPGAAALYEYCVTTPVANDDKSNLEKILKILKNDPASVDYQKVFTDIFYGVTYSDYIFSLPMGAGKTFLMAAFIYLDLYFSSLDPENKAFAQNFIVLAPSGLKSSIIPSLKTIRNFDPSWILPDNVASSIRKEITFEPLESNSSASKSNRTKNPNARKVGLYLRRSMRGVVFVTNAEKVILDRLGAKKGPSQRTLDDEKLDEMSNELRRMIGLIPRLSIFIDEVHHASDDSIKLRQVVAGWAERDSVVTVVGFSGTPYLQKAEKIPIAAGVNYSSTEINNVVYYYPLIQGIGNFLKKPSVTQYENREAYTEIVENGLREFFSESRDTVYKNNTCSKIAIYCNCIEELENDVYASASKICEEVGLNPSESILKYHEDHKEYKLSPDAKMEFETLDTPQSKVRVVLLVQIGKEGWDCRSLTGVILAKENRSTRNMVLQTCCRCLRQVDKYDYAEKAYIYLCKSNAELLEAQLKAEQHITLKEFQEGKKKPKTALDFYNRKRILELPPIDFYQFLVKYNVVSEEEPDVDANLRAIPLEDLRIVRQTITKDFENKVLERSDENNERGKEEMDVATFETWIGHISKESFGFVTAKQLNAHHEELKKIYSTITFADDGIDYFSSKFDQYKIRSLVRQAFYAKRRLDMVSELIENSGELLIDVNFERHKEVTDPERHYPYQDAVHKAIDDDKNGFEGRELMKRRYHYMPYHFDSNFEMEILKHIQEMTIVKQSNLEVYYNGDRFLTEFHIRCYEKVGSRWNYVGQYTPDFLIVERRDDEIYRALIIETKGQIYAQDKNFLRRREFVEQHFLPENEKQYGYRKFEYLYIEDTMAESEQNSRILKAITKFFEVTS
jgi:type III restriction enzyme